MSDAVRVPREPTEAMIAAADRAGMAFAGSDLDSADMTRMIWSAMLAASPQGEGSSADAQGWRDIATAPRDGTRFVGYGRLNRRTEDGCEQSSAPVPHIMQYRSYGVGGDWISTCLGNTISQHPTHWMPLPPLPSADTGELRERVARIMDPISWEAGDVYGWEKAAFIGFTKDGSLTKADEILDII